MLSEASLINQLKTAFPKFMGDDAAVIPKSENQVYVVTKDTLIEDVHFRTTYCSPADLAHKSLHVNLSDCAAMGARPMFILCGIAIPETQADYAREFLSNFILSLKESKVILIGGDTTKSPDKLFISITVIGECTPAQVKYRYSAKPSDVICVAGHLGYAHLGFIACEQSMAGLEDYKEAFLRPMAKIKEGLWLGSNHSVTSMMDISDGLFVDLKRLSTASKVASILEIESLMFDTSFLKACHRCSFDPVKTLLIGGEDYSLLLTVKSECYESFACDFLETFGYRLRSIGRTFAGAGVHFTRNGLATELTLTPFSHFGEKL